MNQPFAAIDIGTNSAILLIAENRNGILEPVFQLATTPRVGRNLSVTGVIAAEAFDVLIQDLTKFLSLIVEKKAKLVGAVATEAFRIAKNGPQLLEKVSELLGIEAQIIAGPEESRLGFLAVANRHPLPKLIAVDIGGGSTEVTRSIGGMSLPIGGVVLLETCGYAADACRQKAREHFSGMFNNWSGALTVIVVGGTASALAMLEQALPKFSSEAIEGFAMKLDQVTSWIDRLNVLSDAERAALPGMDQGRKDILMPGLCIVESLLIELKVNEFKTSDRGIRYGVILDAIKKCSTLSESIVV